MDDLTEVVRAQALAARGRGDDDRRGRQALRGWTQSPGGVWVPPDTSSRQPQGPVTARAEAKDGVFVSLFQAGHLREVTGARIRIERLLAIAALLCPLLLYWLLWRVDLEFWAFSRVQARGTNGLLAVGLVLLSVVLHESLHGAGIVALGRVPWRAVRFRVKKWPKWTPYTTCTLPVGVGAYRQTLLLPLLLLGVVPGLIGFVWRLNGLALLAILNVTFCTSDLVSFWNSLKYKSSSVLRVQQ